VVCGRLADGVMTLEECHRFANRPVRLPDGLHWNLLHLFTEAIGALRGRTLDGVGVDTLGVDYALLDERAASSVSPSTTATSAPTASRASRATRSPASSTCDQHRLPVAADDRIGDADAIALVPDLLAYWLSGVLANERTNASTTALLDARTGEGATGLIERIGLPARLFRDLVEPGVELGRVLAHHEIDAPVYTVASHDTRVGLCRRAAA